MARPSIYKTEEAKQSAARERHRRHYAKNRDNILKRRRELRITKPSQEILEIQKALAEVLGYDEDDTTTSEIETSDDENDKLSDLPGCLLALKEIKDEMLELVREPCAFTETILLWYVKSLPDDGYGKGDPSIIETAKAKVEGLLRRATPVHDLIKDSCGVSDQSRAAESVSRYLSTALAYLDDIQYFLDIEGISELTVAHSMGELMYQKGIRL
ncbi:uncharacterized protein HD556DRAFT_1447443 [Suillus plorans]|uniref:Uncharacterized protein n=1 Tax=Suillus plorans TaxID=116603 RepID=A0A9P7AGP6_9AGAM|nr:uncharacterized protein HD556DRAFT_1447443 [Suillus plorans]KAG1788970.1 hypothetical protein HD556DRAFT_1447443 [Suillus plorans]